MNSPPEKVRTGEGSTAPAQTDLSSNQPDIDSPDRNRCKPPVHAARGSLSFLHIRPDGQEVCYDQRPDDVPCLAVTSYKSHERTCTKLVWLVDDDDVPIIVEPRGVGWRFLGLLDGSAWFWRAAA
jgi:hypothetical protein